MRVLLLLFLFISVKVSSQTKADSLVEFSRLEKLVMTPGKLIKIQAEHIGSSGSLHVGILEATDLLTGEKQKALAFGKVGVYNISFAPSDLHLDAEEIKQFIDILEKLNAVIKAKNTKQDVGYHYIFSNYVVMSMDNKAVRQNRWDITFYKRYRNFDAAVPGYVLTIKDNDIDELITVLKRAVTLLQNN